MLNISKNALCISSSNTKYPEKNHGGYKMNLTMKFANPNVKPLLKTEGKLLTTPDKLIKTGCSDETDKHLEYFTWLIANGNDDYFYKLPVWYKNTRPHILERDKWECQLCKAQGRLTVVRRRGYVHHICEFKDFPNVALNYNNLITLCYRCHELTHDRLFKLHIQEPKENNFSNFEDTETW